MYSNLKKGLFLVTFSGAAMLLPVTAKAADTQSELPSVGIEEVLDHCYSSGKEIEIEKYLVPTKKGEYLDMAFADVETFLYIRSEPTTESEWVGKLYPDDAAKIMGPVDEWTKVQSGSVTGYVYSKYITVGKKAEEKAQKIVKKKQEKRLEKKKIEKENPEKEEVLEKPEQIFEYAESKEEEEARLEKEAEEARRREEEARKKAEEEAKEKAGSGQAIVDYACQFIGNPYVWGGTSLTNGADCSGFVLSVFKNYGISLPHSSRAQGNCGSAVSYSELKPGDLVFYGNRSGINHVAIYVGGGQVVHASNPRTGITISGMYYRTPVRARRIIND